MMIGAIIGDIAGSVYECNPIKTEDFELFSDNSGFTDDTVLTMAIFEALDGIKSKNIKNEKEKKIIYAMMLKEYALKYPDAGYGGSFRRWIASYSYEPYGSFGNGSAMRVSPVAYFFDSEEEILNEARITAEVTHNHVGGVKGVQATAIAIYFARKGKDKEFIKNYIEEKFGYNLSRKLEEIRPTYKFDETCQGSVPESIIAFLESKSFEDAIRKAVSLGGDSDTMACISGAIAEAYYKDIPEEIINKAKHKLPNVLIEVLDKMVKRFDKVLLG